LPIALPDGWIVLSKEVLDICDQDPAQSEDRLAFVLAHEIAHQLYNDFSHIRFFQASKSPLASTFVLEKLVDNELHADWQGIRYAAMAGFHTQAIVTLDRHVDFFAEWIRAIERIGGVAVEQMRPTPQERAEALRNRLRQIVDQIPMFQVGLWFTYAGNYPSAIQAFEDFHAVFPSREVSHNLAASHHQLALQAYQAWQGKPPLPFQLSLAITPMTRASRIYLEGPTRGGATTAATPEAQFRQHLEAAIGLYREALTHDSTYTPAALNLACALIVRGQQGDGQADFANAIALLKGKLNPTLSMPDTAALLNNLAVAYWYDEQRERAVGSLHQALTQHKEYAPALFNLAQMTRGTGPQHDPQRHQGTAPLPSVELVLDLGIGRRPPASWQVSTQSTVTLEGKRWTLTAYRNGVMTLAKDGDIVMVMTPEGYQGTSTRMIKLGKSADEVLQQYGSPSRRMELPSGQTWAYDDYRIAFQLRDGRVVSWLVF